MITVTDNAVRQLRALLESRPEAEPKGLRVGIAMVLPLIVMSIILAGELSRRVAPPARISNPISETVT